MEAQNSVQGSASPGSQFCLIYTTTGEGEAQQALNDTAQSHENKRAEIPKASNFSTWDTVANTIVDTAHSSKQNNSAAPPRRKELPVAHRIMSREV